MLNIEIDYRNVETRIDCIQEYIEHNIIRNAEEYYKMLCDCLREEAGLFTNELIHTLEKEKICVLLLANDMKALCESIQHMSTGFEEIDQKIASSF